MGAQAAMNACKLSFMENAERLSGLSLEQANTTRLLGRSLIDTFGQGWERSNLDMLMSVFTPDVVFIETPFSEPLKGLDLVRGYWADTPYNQSEVAFSSGEIHVAGPWFSTEFRCRFRRRRTGERVEALGAIFCETAGDRISEM